MPDNPNALTIDNSALVLWEQAAGVMTTGFAGCDRPAAGLDTASSASATQGAR